MTRWSDESVGSIENWNTGYPRDPEDNLCGYQYPYDTEGNLLQYCP